jgi:hypothetical protein
MSTEQNLILSSLSFAIVWTLLMLFFGVHLLGAVLLLVFGAMATLSYYGVLRAWQHWIGTREANPALSF